MRTQIEERIAELIDPSLMKLDPTYHTQVAMFRKWLVTTERALMDEGISPREIDAVLNRIVYAAPDGSGAGERQTLHQTLLEHVRTCPVPASTWLGSGRKT